MKMKQKRPRSSTANPSILGHGISGRQENKVTLHSTVNKSVARFWVELHSMISSTACREPLCSLYSKPQFTFWSMISSVGRLITMSFIFSHKKLDIIGFLFNKSLLVFLYHCFISSWKPLSSIAILCSQPRTISNKNSSSCAVSLFHYISVTEL